jgi:beta-mannosidase
VYADLLAANEIPDPYFRDNENQLQWIGESDWVYESTFTVSKDLLAKERVLLRCEGLDTLATLKLNGKVIGTADNMYRIWEFDVREALKPGKNRISVTFASAISYIQEKGKELHIEGHHTPNLAHIRKQPCNFGWDWGIKAVTCGIWRPISLVAYDTARISDVHVTQDHSRKGAVGLTVDTGVERTGRAKLTARVTVQLRQRRSRTLSNETRNHNRAHNRNRVESFDYDYDQDYDYEEDVSHKPGKVIVGMGESSFTAKRSTIELQVNDPLLWWPNNMGDQPLYTVTVELMDRDGNLLDTWSKRIGLRTLKLGLHRDEFGESFQFEVNGIPFFAKGTNWVPADAILSRITAERYRDRVQ